MKLNLPSANAEPLSLLPIKLQIKINRKPKKNYNYRSFSIRSPSLAWRNGLNLLLYKPSINLRTMIKSYAGVLHCINKILTLIDS